jgi:phosphoesterase RecJ-like protein
MKMPGDINATDVLHRIDAATRIVLTTHARGDGDAIGCVAALRRLLLGIGKPTEGYLHEDVPPRYACLPEVSSLKVWDVDTTTVLRDADLLLVLDTCATSQLDKIAPAIRAAPLKKIAVDHHLTRDAIVDEGWFDTHAAACAQLILMLAETAGWRLDGVSAELLFAALATDTGWFRFSNADTRSFEDAARLMACGAKPNELYEKLYLNDTPVRARLIGEVMSSFELLANGRLAVTTLSRAALERCGATSQMTEDLINEPQRVGIVVVSVMLVEPEDDGPVRVSFRSKRDVDVAALAATFGGGGHARAAGAKISGTLAEVRQQVINALLQAMDAAR